MCDDIDITVKDNHITDAKRACVLGKAWFYNHHADDRPSCLIEGRPASVAEGVERAARILTEAKYPIIYGLSDTTSEAQRVAVGIGDAIAGTVDTTTSVCHGPSGMAFQGVGEVTCTLGEIANRGDLIIFWGGNPAESHPRHFTKYSLMPKGMFVPNGRKDRTAVGVDVRKTKTAKAMDLFFQIKPRSDFEALWTLRALAKGIEVDPEQVKNETGIELARWQDLMDRMKAAKFGVILFGMGLTMTRGKHLNSEALLSLARDMNAFTRFVVQADARPRQCDRRRQRRDLADGLSVRREHVPRLPAVQSRGIHDVRHAGARRGRRRAAHRLRSDGELQPAGPRATEVDSVHRAGSQGHADDPCGHGGVHHRHLRHQHARHRLPHGRRADFSSSRVSLAPSERLRRALRDPATSDWS